MQLWFFFDSRFICDAYLLSIYFVHIYSSVFIIAFLFHYYFIFVIAVEMSCVLTCLMTMRVLKEVFKKNEFIVIARHFVPPSNAKCPSDHTTASPLQQKESHVLGTFLRTLAPSKHSRRAAAAPPPTSHPQWGIINTLSHHLQRNELAQHPRTRSLNFSHGNSVRALIRLMHIC